ncbi:MAG: hypothetical protein V4693_14255 [Pseudomonadota bacterium]
MSIAKTGKCKSHGHPVVVERDVDGNIRASVGTTIVEPLPDEGQSGISIVACQSCVELVHELRLP